MRRHLAYARYVIRHKWFVLLESIKLGVPWLGLIHDWSKLLPSEWFPYAYTFYTRKGSKMYEETPAFVRAWMKHQHRNKHHWQYWLNVEIFPLPDTSVLVWDRGEASVVFGDDWLPCDGMITVREPMPDRYRREMLADWIGAGRALGKPDTKAWYLANKDRIKLHPETRQWIERQLGVM